MDLSPDEDQFQGRLLHQAALWDNEELLVSLLAAGADVDARDARARSALHAAALAERSRCLRALCAAGADVDARSDDATGGKTALHIAAERGHAENVAALLRAGAALGARDAAGATPLQLAERAGHRLAARALRDARDALERSRLSQHAALRELVQRGEAAGLRARLAALGAAAPLCVNLTPQGANTLLYVAVEAGQLAAATALLAAGADGRAHPVTKYSPLYIACYHGHRDLVQLLLKHFPEAVQQETVEKWLPLHAACIGGHAALVTLLLEYPYPPELLSTYTDVTGKWQYQAAFDVNALDARGQSALYVASTLGCVAVADALLSHTVPCQPVKEQTEEPDPPLAPPAVLSPQRGISLGIQAIVSRLTGSTAHEGAEERRVRPVQVELGRGSDSCVACAARGGHVRTLRRLLAAGARAAASAAPPESESEGARDSRRRSRSASAAGSVSPSPSPGRLESDRSAPWTALAVAVRHKHVAAAAALLRAGAEDPHGLALRECARHGFRDLMCAVLASRAYPDPEYKLNKGALSALVLGGRRDPALTHNALVPRAPVVVHWRALHANLDTLRMSWLSAAALRVNPALSSDTLALHAVTRLELAHNELRALPAALFSLLSLRYLNVAQNKLERLPLAPEPAEGERRPPAAAGAAAVYSAPVLQELYLQDNRLESIPAELFSLPALATLDVSNNKLRALPPQLWRAPALRDLNAALNLLRDLPVPQESGGAPAAESPQASASPSLASSHSSFSFSQTSVSEGEEDAGPTLGDRSGHAICTEAARAHPWRSESVVAGAGAGAGEGQGEGGGASALTSLNLSHNLFTRVPPPLACLAPRLATLNMAYNSLRSMSYVTSYPTHLRQLDLSHNEITCWPSLPQVEKFASPAEDPLACYCRGGAGGAGSRRPRPRPRSGGVRAQLLHYACPARSHLRLDSLRTLILANNMLTRIQLTTDDDGGEPERDVGADDDDEWSCAAGLRARLVCPQLSMLDVSCNLLRALPPLLHALTNLSVLNISGNKEITELPPQMGLLSRLWNLNTAGCALQEPLASMVAGGRYKSMDIVGYLKSVLQEALPYTRMKLMLVGLQGIGKTSLLECLRQESPPHLRRKATDHWALRMGNKSSARALSTVGVDIGAWAYEPPRASRGPVSFRTWDFGGQQEYYATHQYFLSRRSLYLVVWKVTDGRRGLAEAIDWLRSIQARAPGSPVIMVGTHLDQVVNSEVPESESPAALQRLVRAALLHAPDADKKGLPRVLDSVEVSCTTKHNIRLLADTIYSVAFSVKPPGSKEPLLEQRIPATYLALEECVTSLAAELREPVLNYDEYKRLVTQYMQAKGHRGFRDAAELHHATMFLHENGVLVHYDDAALKQLYFLRPQWLCDVLAHVVTVREINPFANNGIMKMEDLAHVFKASPLLARGEEASALGVSLLTKFELALCWDSRTLLVPPLLPADEPPAPQLPLRTRTWPGTPRRAAAPLTALAPRADSPSLIQEAGVSLSIQGRSAGRGLRRVLLLSYAPSGLWARLCSRVLADPALPAAAHALYTLPPDMEVEPGVAAALEPAWAWKLWRGGLQLQWGALVAARACLLPPRHDPLLGGGAPPAPHDLRYRVKQEGAWWTLEATRCPRVELRLPALVCVARRADGAPLAGYQSISLEPSGQALTRLLALLADHVDLLLEDWYPSLGTRFVHTSEGRCLVTRVAPCPRCLAAFEDDAQRPEHLAQALQQVEVREGREGAEGERREGRGRGSQESRASDQDSGVGADSTASSRLGSVEGALSPAEGSPVVQGWTVEQCLLHACTAQPLACPAHGPVPLQDVAPDALLLDVEESQRARWEHIVLESVAGRGAFGTVLAGVWRPPGRQAGKVAVKALQPVPPPRAQHHHAYKVALARWERSPTAGACRAYCGLRQELSVLRVLRHPHVLRLRAVCAAPLALLLEQAPLGALDKILRTYGGMGARVGPRAARALALQLARALEYLHAQRVLYRDLKSENVLVWEMPSAQEAAAAEGSPAPVPVLVKLGDYGISRLAPPSGTKGFGGTEGFMAPEIMRYNGEQEYNEKVDCFSFGMLLYEIITLRQPFEGHEAVKEAILDGARPSLTPRDLQYPCNILETMRRCWRGAPELRPSAAALVSAAAAPEFTALLDAAACRPAVAAVAVPLPAVTDEGAPGWEVWYGGGEPERLHTLLCTEHHFTQHHTLRLPPDGAAEASVTALCRVGAHVWCGDSRGRVAVYSASTCALVWSTRVQDSVGGAASAVAALQPLPQLRRVALALQCGRLFLVNDAFAGARAEAEAEAGEEAESGFVLTELGTASQLCCLVAVPSPQGFELWAGGSGLYTYAVSGAGVCGAETLQATPTVTLLAACADEPYVALYSHPGVYVYQWSVRTRRQTGRLDCSKLVPCSESLQSLALDSRLGEDLTRVTALCALGGALYVGTAWGVLAAVAAPQLRPLAVFRPYDHTVSAIIPLRARRGGAAMLATLGNTHRPLLARFVSHQSNQSTHEGPHCLLWRAGHWLPD